MNESAALHPLITVCIPNFNGMAFIDNCLQSVLAQQGQFDLEIIVHDDHSSDGSLEHIRTAYPSITIIDSPKNVGFCVANNRMAAAANGMYLLLLNNDAALFPDAIPTLLKNAQRMQQPAILSLPQYDANTGALLDIGSRLDPFLNPVPNLVSTRYDVGMVAGACLWIDKSLWVALGGFPPWFESIGEDLYLCCRARRCGYAVCALGESGYHHHVGASFGGGKTQNGKLLTNFRRRALSERNKTFVMVMCFPGPVMHLWLPLHLIFLLLEGLVLSVLLGNPNFWRQIYWPILPALWLQRMKLNTTRAEILLRAGNRRPHFFSAFNWCPHKLTLLLRHGLPTVR